MKEAGNRSPYFYDSLGVQYKGVEKSGSIVVMYQIWRYKTKQLKISEKIKREMGRWWVYAHHFLYLMV
jgi:hypothetical protein